MNSSIGTMINCQTLIKDDYWKDSSRYSVNLKSTDFNTSKNRKTKKFEKSIKMLINVILKQIHVLG